MTLGFVIVRHVTNLETDEYWKESYRCVRKFYPENPILIVDDNSDKVFLDENIELINVKYAQSEFKGSGEILGYYYFHKLHFFDTAVIIHDSVFLNSYVDFESFGDVKSLWSFYQHAWDDDQTNLKIISEMINNSDIVKTYHEKKWCGCFGVMSVINWTFLDRINAKYNFFRTVLPNIINRERRCCMERIFACVCHTESETFGNPKHIFGDILDPRWGHGRSFKNYKEGNASHLPIIKVWTGR
jgi:hypothetical protein